MRLRAQFGRFHRATGLGVFALGLLVAADSLAELPQAIVAQAPNQPRGSWFPNPGLLLGSDGAFYGTTRGQNAVNGSVFKYTLDATAYDTVLPFSASEVVYSGLAEGPDGALYGNIYSGTGSIALGAVFKVTKTGVFSTLHAFTGPDGANPYGPLAIAADGTIYGTTYNGGADTGDGFGTVFQIAPDGTFNTLHDFGVDDGAAHGAHPQSNLLIASDGSLYGTTATGGEFDGGAVFRLTTAGEIDSVAFGESNGFGPHDLVLTCNTLFGRAFGANGRVFQVSLSLGPVSTLHALADAEGSFDFNEGDGQTLGGGLIVGQSGKLYGVAEFAPGERTGTVFELALDGTFSVLYTFQDSGTDGRMPWGIAQGPDGNLYGTQQGTNNGGGIFKLTVPPEMNTPVACPAGTGGTGNVDTGGAGGTPSAGGSSASANGGSDAVAATGGTATSAGNGGASGDSATEEDEQDDEDEDEESGGGCSYAGTPGNGSSWAFLVIALSALGLSRRRSGRSQARHDV